MTSTNDGKDVINIRSSGQKGKTYYIELFKSIDAGLSSDCELRVRTRHLCDAWQCIHSICQQSAQSTLPHLLNWIQRHTARTVLQTEWNKTESKDENHKLLEDAINDFLEECRITISRRNGVSPPWESQLVQRGKWFKQTLGNPWGHPVLRVLLDSEAQPPSDKEVLEWLKEERSLMFSTRLRQLAADKRCVDLALLLVSAVMDRRRATITLIPDVEQMDTAKDKPVPQSSTPTFVDELKEAGFVQDMWELLTDMEFVLLHKRDKRARCIELAKQTPLRDGYQLIERLRSRPETSPREKKLWKNARDVATLIAQVLITRCMVVTRCAGPVRSVLFCCTSSLVRLLPAARLPAAAAALAAPAATARHLHTLAAAVNKQLQCTSDMKPFVCELYVRAITAAMNELERLKLKTEKEAEARDMQQMLAAWVTQLGALLAASQRLRCECALTAFSVHPSAHMYEAIRAAPPLHHKVVHESKEEQTISEFGSWASDSRSQTNFVKTSETLNLKQTQHRANVLSTAILNEGEALGLSPELCQDITVLLSGLRLKTLSWDMDRELLLENCRTYMERTGAGTRAVTTELKYLNLDPRHFEHLPFEDDDENDIYYGIEKGYEHLVELYQEPEDIWPVLDDPEQTESSHSTDMESKVIPRVRKKKIKKIPVIYDQEVDPLSFATDSKIKEKKKERPHSKERSKDRSTGKFKMEIPKDPLELDSNSERSNDTKEIKKEQGKEKKKRGRKKKDITVKSESKASSLSSLIGVKVTRPIDFESTCKSNKTLKHAKATPNTMPASDSVYDSQGKSSLKSLSSEENDPNVLFDGLFSMDELKSPDRSTDKPVITKNNEVYLTNASIAINTTVPKSVSKNIEPIINKISHNSNCATNQLTLEAKSKKEVTEDVKNSLSKLLQYRRDKTVNKLYEQNRSYAQQPYTNSTTAIDRDVGKLTNTIVKTQFSSQSSQQALKVPNTPKVHINKRQSEQLAGLKIEIGNMMKSQISSKQVTPQYVQNVNRNIDDIRLSKLVHSSILCRPEDNYVVQNELLQKSISTSNELKSPKSQNRDTASQNNFQDFLYELQKSINAGTATDPPNVLNRIVKKEIRPISRVTPINPVSSTIELKQQPQSSKPLAQQMKLKTAPNTFSRLSYMHKNSIMNDQRMSQIQACIEHQDQALKNPGTPLITDHNLTEIKRSKLKYLQGKDLIISRVNKSLLKPNDSSQLPKKNRNPNIETAVSADHPVMSSMLMQNNLISTHKTYLKDRNQTKHTQIDRHRDYTKITPNRSKSELSEKDQNDLLLLLRQQRKQKATQPKFGNIATSGIQPSQGPSTNSIIHSNKYDTVKYHQSTGNLINTPSSNQEAKFINYQSSSIKPIHSIQSNLHLGPRQKSDMDLVKTELKCTKNVNLQPTKNQKTELRNKIDGKSDIKEWESVLNEILSYKTPKRVPSILEIPVNKNTSVYRQNQVKDILTTPLVSKSIGDSIQIIPKVKEQIKTSATKSVSNEVPIHNSRKDPRFLRKSLTKIYLKNTKNKTSAQTQDSKTKPDTTNTSSAVRHTNPTFMKPVQSEVPKGQFQAGESKRLSQNDIPKRYNNIHKKPFTYSLPKEDDPFISGIRNSDYDLLEELMDDDLRQEIGELSDDDCYSSSMSAQKDSKFIVVNRGTISQEEKSLVDAPASANHHQTPIKSQNTVKCYKSYVSTPDTSVIIQTKFDNNESKVMNLSRNIISTPGYNNNIDNIKSQVTMDQSNAFHESVAQQTTLQNLVLIGSEIVYTQPCTVTQIPIASITPKPYVALNNQSNMALYQTTQFSAPVINPLIVGNATTLISAVPFENMHSRPVLKNTEVDKFSNHHKISEKDFLASEPKFDVNLLISGDNGNGKCHSVLESKKGMLDFNCNKNGERKVLSEVQAKFGISKIVDDKVIRNRTVLVNNDMKKEMSKDQERLKQKRMDILNRNIYHRCNYKPIALTYAPIEHKETVLRKDQEKQVEDNSNVSCNNNSNKKIELFSRQVEKKPSLSQRSIASVISCESVNNQENSKENKTDSLPCRRILLRSSNKLSKIESSDVKPLSETLSVKTKADENKSKLKGKCKNTLNHNISQKTFKKQISTKVKPKLKNKKTETFGKYSLGNIKNSQINYYKQEIIDSKSSISTFTEKVDVEDQLIALKIPKQISEPSRKISQMNNQTENQTLLANQNKSIHESFKDNESLDSLSSDSCCNQQESLEVTIVQALSEKVDVEEQLIALKIPKQNLLPEPSTIMSIKNDQSENQISLVSQNFCERVEDCSKDNESLQHHILDVKNLMVSSEKFDVEEQLIAQKIPKQGLLIEPSTEMCLTDSQAENQTLNINQNMYERLYDISKDNASLQQDSLEVKSILALSDKVDIEDQPITLKNPKEPLPFELSTKMLPINNQSDNQNKSEHVYDNSKDYESPQEPLEVKNVPALSEKVNVEEKVIALKISKQISLSEHSTKMSPVNNQTENQTLPASQSVLSEKIDDVNEQLIAFKLSKQVLPSTPSTPSTIISPENKQTENPTLTASHKFEHIHDNSKYNQLRQDSLEVRNEPVISEKVDVKEQLVPLKIPKQVLQTSLAIQNKYEHDNESLHDSPEIKNINHEMQVVLNDKKGKSEDKISMTEYNKALDLQKDILKNNDVIKKLKQYPKNNNLILPATQPSNPSPEVVKSKLCNLGRGNVEPKSNEVFKDNTKNISDVGSTDKPNNKKDNDGKRKLVANSNTQILNIISDSKSAKEINGVISVPQSYKDSIIIEEIPIKDNNSFKKCVMIKLPSGRVFKGTVYSEINVNVDTLFSDPTIRNLLLSNLTDRKRYTLNVKHPSTKNNVVESSIKEDRVSKKNNCDYIETINLLSDEEVDDSNQFLNIDNGKYKVNINKTDLLKHQKRFNEKCFVKLNRLDLPQSINDVELIYEPIDEITSVNSDTVCSDIITQNWKESVNKLPMLTSTLFNTENQITSTPIKEKLDNQKSNNNNFIEIDDLSNDSPKLNGYDSSKLSMGKVKMNDLKDLLLLDLGITEQIKDNATEELTSEVNNIINDSACQMVDRECDYNIPIVLNSVVATGHKEGSMFFTQSCNNNCYVKLTNCDELAMKHEQLKLMKQNCFVKLVRCDHQVNIIKESTKREADNADEETDDIIDKVTIGENSDFPTDTLSRSGSFSILNEYSVLDDPPIPVEFERSNSPVIDVYEAIITLNNNFIDNTELSLFTENSVCKSEWCMTKTELRLQNVLIMNEVHRDNKVEEHLTNNFNNVQIIRVTCSQSACVFNAPKLTTILTKFFQDNYHIIDRLNIDSVLTKTNMRLKRKLTTFGGTTIKRKMNKKCFSEITAQEVEECKTGANSINGLHFRDQVNCNNHGMTNLDVVETDKFLNTEQTSTHHLKQSGVLKIENKFIHMHDTAQYSQLRVEQRGIKDIETEKCTPNISFFRKNLQDNNEVPQKINCINDLTMKNNLPCNNHKMDSMVKQNEHNILCLKDDNTNNLLQNICTHHISEGIGHEISDANVVDNKNHKFQTDEYNEIDIDVHGNKQNLICSENTILYEKSKKIVHEIINEDIVYNKYNELQINVPNKMDVEVNNVEQHQVNIKNFANDTKNKLVLKTKLNENSLKFTQDVTCGKNETNEFQRDLQNKMYVVEEGENQNKLNMTCLEDFEENDLLQSAISRQKSKLITQKIKNENDTINQNYELNKNMATEIDTLGERGEQVNFNIIPLKDDDINNTVHDTTLSQSVVGIIQGLNNWNESINNENNTLHTDLHNQSYAVMDQNQLSRSSKNNNDFVHVKSLCMLRETSSSTSKQISEKVTHKLNINSFHIDNSEENHEKSLKFTTENKVRTFNIITSIANDNYSELITCSTTAEEKDKTANSCNHMNIVDASVNNHIDSFKRELISSDSVDKIVQVENMQMGERVVDHKQIDIDYKKQRDTVKLKYEIETEKLAQKMHENIDKNIGTDRAQKMCSQQYTISSDSVTECVDVNIDLNINHKEISFDNFCGLERDIDSQQYEIKCEGNLNNAVEHQEIAFDGRHVQYAINRSAANDVQVKTDKNEMNHKEIITVDNHTIKSHTTCEPIPNKVSNHQEVAYDDRHAQYVISGSAVNDIQEKTGKNEIDHNKIIKVDNYINEDYSDTKRNKAVREHFNHKKPADDIHLHLNREYYEVVHKSVSNMQIKFDEKLSVQKTYNEHVDFQDFEVASENVAENVEVGDENVIKQNEVTIDCIYEIVTADVKEIDTITEETIDVIETPNVYEHDYTIIPKSLKQFGGTDVVYSDLGKVTSLRAVDTQDVTNFVTEKGKSLCESGFSRVKIIDDKYFLLKRGNITSLEEKEQTNGNENADTPTQEIWESDSDREKNKDILSAESDSGILLKGLEFEDPEMGICYVFPLVTNISESSDSDANNITDEILELRCDEEINHNFKLNIPNRTYSKECIRTGTKFRALCYDKKSKKCLKRKIGMMDIQNIGKKYRKGKGIDHPKITITHMSEMGYTKQFKRLFDYFSSVKFSYSLNFHKENINVHNMLCNWPIQSFCDNAAQVGSEIEENLFKDIETSGKPIFFDPNEQTLAEEILTEYEETNYSFNNINETNFNMGFGEGSDRVIHNLKEGDDSLKKSAAALSDVKQSQPLSVSASSTSNFSTVRDQIEKLQRHYAHVQLRDRVRSFFRKTKAELTHDWLKDNKKDNSGCDIRNFPFGLTSPEFIEPPLFETVVHVVQVGQLPVSATAQNPVTCDPRVTQVANVSPAQCTAESSPNGDPQVAIKTEYTELTTADLSLPIVPEYTVHKQTMQMESQEAPNLHMSDEKYPVEAELKSVIKIEMVEETPEIKTEFDENGEINESQIASDKDNINNANYCFSNIDANANIAQDNTNSVYDLSKKQIISDVFPQQILQKEPNGSLEKTDQIAHAMSAAGITTTDENITNTRAHALVNILAQKILQNNIVSTPSSMNTYPKTTSINAMALQQALSQMLPPPLNQTNVNDNNQQAPNSSVTSQVLHIVQSKNSSGNQITLVDNTQQSVINTPNATPVLHIVQNKGNAIGPTSDGTSTPQTNTFSGLSLSDTGLQQGGNQLLHIVNTGNQKTTNAGQLLKRVNLLTNLTNVQGSSEQKMVQFVCKSADGKAIQLNASHQRGMVLRLQPIETSNTQATQAKSIDANDISPLNNTNTDPIKETVISQQEIKSRSIYEENYAKFIQNSSNKTTVLEKSTSLPKFNQAFGKQVFQDSNQNQHDINNSNSHLPSINSNNDSTECQSTDNAINLEHISQISSPPLLLRKSPSQTSQAQPNLIQQIKQTMAPMNLQTMHGGVIYTRQIPVNIGGGQTINLITVPSTELIDDSTQKQQTDVKFINQGEIEPSIIKIVPQTANPDISNDENNTHAGGSNENSQSQPPPVLTQMRIKLPMLSKAPQMVSGARVVRPSFFQIQRNVIGGGNQPVYQQLVLTAAPPLGQQTIRLPQAPTSRQIKVPSETHSSSESQMSSSTLEQLREFDLVLEQVKERSTVQPNTKSNGPYSKLHTVSNDTTDGTISASTTSAETTQQVLYSVGNSQSLNVAYVNRKATISTSVRSPDSSGAADSSTTPTHIQHRRHTVTSDLATSETPAQSKPTKVSSKSRSRPKASSNPPNTLKLNSVPPKTSTQKPVEDEQTTQRILYILAEYREQVENSPDKDKPAPRRRSNPPLNPSGSSKRKKSSSSSRRPGGRDISPVHGDDTCRTIGSEDSSCGTSQGDCNESCLDSHSPENSPRKIVRKLTFDNEMPITQPRPQPQRNVIVADGQTITVARGTAGKPATAVLMPANYILPVSLVKGGQQIAIVTNRGPKLLTVGGGEGGATNALLLQRLIGPAGLKPILTRPGVRHIRLPTAALHNLQAFNLATTTTVQPSDSTGPSTVSTPTLPELVKTRANSSLWTDRDCQDVKPERASSPECSEPWNIPSSADPHDYIYEETVRADNMNRTVLVVHRKDGSSHRQHRLTHVSAAALRHKYAILEHELRLQKSLSEECEDLGVDSPSASELFPEAELLFAASPAHDHTQDQTHHSHTPQPTVLSQSGITQPDIDDQIAADQLLTRNDLQDDRSDLNLGLEDVGIVTVSEDGMQATIALDQEEFARSHPNTTFHSEPTDDGEVQPYTISDLKARHITSTIFHSNRTPGTVLMTAPQTTVISQATAVSSGVQNIQNVKYSDIDNMINSLPCAHANTINLSSVLVKDDGLTRYDHILNDSRELHLSNTASAIVHSTGNATQVIKRLYYDDDKRDTRYMMDEPEDLIARDDAKMIVEDSSRDATLESMADVEDYRSSPDRNTELFWESNSASERSESRRPLDFSSDSDKCCKSPSFDETNSTDSSGVGAHIRLDSVIKDTRGIERSGSADGSSADDTHPPLRTYPAKRLYHHPLDGDIRHSVSGKTRAGERSPFPTGAPDTLEGRRRASARGVVKRCCHCCNGSPAPPRPKKIRQKKPTMDFINHH